MIIRFLLALLATAGASGTSHSFPIELMEYVGTHRVVAFIDAKDVEAVPTWRPFQGPPPETMEEALEDVRDYVAADEIFESARVEQVSLRQIPHLEDRWHYVVALETNEGAETRNRYLVVLMNGKIVPAIEAPQSIK